MSKEKKARSEAKKAAWAAKKEQEGVKVMNWIIGILIALGILFVGYTIAMM